jgi:hypothetical protein
MTAAAAAPSPTPTCNPIEYGGQGGEVKGEVQQHKVSCLEILQPDRHNRRRHSRSYTFTASLSPSLTTTHRRQQLHATPW